jgi:hypothetical protein
LQSDKKMMELGNPEEAKKKKKEKESKSNTSE